MKEIIAEETRVTKTITLEEATSILQSEMENVAESYIAIGFYLKKIRDEELYKEKGFKNLHEYALETFRMSRTWAERIMEINDKFSEGGSSPQLAERYRGYGKSLLSEMLYLPEEIREEVPVTATVRDVREVAQTIRETKENYEDQTSLFDTEQEECDWMELLVRKIFETEKDSFKKMVDWIRKDPEREIEEEILAIVNPTKFKMVRLDKANVMMSEKSLKVMPYRGQGEQKTYTYVAFGYAFEKVFYPNYPDITMPIQKVYETVYEKPLYETMKTPEKPVNTTTTAKTKKETKEPEVKKEAKTEKKPINTECEPDLKEKKEEPEKSEQKMEEKPINTECEQVPGQTNIEKDFPQYCPEKVDAVLETKKEEVKPPYRTRMEYIQGLSKEELAEYMAKAMKENKSLSFAVLLRKEHWESWLKRLVDEEGKVIEEG